MLYDETIKFRLIQEEQFKTASRIQKAQDFSTELLKEVSTFSPSTLFCDINTFSDFHCRTHVASKRKTTKVNLQGQASATADDRPRPEMDYASEALNELKWILYCLKGLCLPRSPLPNI